VKPNEKMKIVKEVLAGKYYDGVATTPLDELESLEVYEGLLPVKKEVIVNYMTRKALVEFGIFDQTKLNQVLVLLRTRVELIE
jgi:hypothetical protein